MTPDHLRPLAVDNEDSRSILSLFDAQLVEIPTPNSPTSSLGCLQVTALDLSLQPCVGHPGVFQGSPHETEIIVR